MARLTAAARKKIPTSSFAVPEKAKTARGKAKSGSYPIPDKNHAIAAERFSKGKPERAEVMAKVRAKFPDLGGGKKKSAKKKGK